MRESTRSKGPKAVRFSLMRRAATLLFDRNKTAAEQEKVCWCHRTIRNKAERIGCYRRADGTDARLSGLATCLSVWVCPVCSYQICEGRQRELEYARVTALGMGYESSLLTLTFPHVMGEDLAGLIKRFDKARQRFRNSASWRAMEEEYDMIGAITALEVTYGKNGWHPHLHILLFSAPGIDSPAMIRRLKRAWLKACIREGLVKPDGTMKPIKDALRHGLDLRMHDDAARYIADYAKWGITSEVTRFQAKIGVRRAVFTDELHVTPFQLLEWSASGDKAAGHLFREYAAAFKGKRMLNWSRGLKKRLRVGEIEDDALVNKPLDAEEHVGWINPEQFSEIIRRDAYNEFREYLAEYCVKDGQSDIDEWIEFLKHSPPTHSGAVRVRKFIGSGYLTWHDQRETA